MEITLKLNANTKAGKTLLSLIEYFVNENKSIKVVKNSASAPSPYNKEFVKEIQKARKSKKRYQFNSAEQLWESL